MILNETNSPTLDFLLVWLSWRGWRGRCAVLFFFPPSIWAECQGKLYWSVLEAIRCDIKKGALVFESDNLMWNSSFSTYWNLGKSLSPFELSFPLMHPSNGCQGGLITMYYAHYYSIYYLLSAGYSLGIVLRFLQMSTYLIISTIL